MLAGLEVSQGLGGRPEVKHPIDHRPQAGGFYGAQQASQFGGRLHVDPPQLHLVHHDLEHVDIGLQSIQDPNHGHAGAVAAGLDRSGQGGTPRGLDHHVHPPPGRNAAHRLGPVFVPVVDRVSDPLFLL